MENSDQLLETAGESYAYIQQHLKKRVELAKLEAAERSAKVISSLAANVVIGLIGASVLMLATITLGLFIGSWIGSYALAFLILTFVYLLAGVGVYFFKDKIIIDPVVTLVLERFFD